MHKQTKALSIPREVKEAVRKRDGGCCILCGSPYGEPNAHYLPRSRGGLGIEENIVTLCFSCHTEYDNGAGRRETEEKIRQYLKYHYPNWEESKLYYRKWNHD